MDVSTALAEAPARSRADSSPLALAVADANWFTTDHLFAELRVEGVSALLLDCLDYQNAWRRGERPWSWNPPLRADGPRLWRRKRRLPPGWMKRFPRLGMRPVASAIREWHERFAAGADLALVMTYPHYLYLRDLVRPDRSVYFNVDDYALYWPSRAEEIRALERRAVLESSLTVCTSHLRSEELKAAVPEAAPRVRHLPHGAPSWSIAEGPFARPAELPEEIAHLPRPILGYLGSLEDRLDWALIGRLADRFPRASIVLVGRERPGGDEPWHRAMKAALGRANVHAVGWVPQDRIGAFYRSFDVSLIPYLTDHPFNVACCPTKINDAMGSGRPVVSTDLPECRLHRERFDVAETAGAFLDAVGAILESGSDDGRSALRHAFAVENSCRATAARLVDWIDRAG